MLGEMEKPRRKPNKGLYRARRNSQGARGDANDLFLQVLFTMRQRFTMKWRSTFASGARARSACQSRRRLSSGRPELCRYTSSAEKTGERMAGSSRQIMPGLIG